ncbi:MAG: efflux RND transporter permease subunit [Acidobacteria bacterium]|nr:efflux RND transporter permease subunit [Acidobacteriota bacterium]
MLNAIIRSSLKNRLLVVAIAAFVVVYGTFVLIQIPVDVFPDFNRPTVTVMTEAHGLAPEEVEALVTLPMEMLLNGATNVQRVRSVSSAGLSIIYVEFDWGSNIYTDRQIVAEKLQLAQTRLPAGTVPVMGPISSIMGSILLVGLHSESGETSPLEVRTLADWVLRPRLLAVPGVANVINIGGGVKQFQVLANPVKLRDYQISLDELRLALAQSNSNTTGGFLESGGQEYLIRNLGRAFRLEDLATTVVAYRNGLPVYVKDVARVQFGPQIKRGEGGLNRKPAVIASIYKQPDTNTLTLTRDLERALDEVQAALPRDVKINREVFRQSSFIEAAIHNVEEALAHGAILVTVILFLFLWNFRTTAITLTAIPLSFLITALFMRYFNISINTMTLGGLAIAIGELVDDAIIDVENVFRRLRENRQKPRPDPSLLVIFRASSEIRNSIVYATVIIILVFVPLFYMGGIEGRIFVPLGVAYIVSILASLVVSLTVTPALCSYLLPKARIVERKEDTRLVKWLKAQERRLLNVSLDHPWRVLLGTLVLVVVALSVVPLMGREFLPPFNEGSLTVLVLAEPGTALTESNRLGTLGEQLLLQVPEMKVTGRRTGRAELDEHAEGVHYTEIEANLKPSRRSREEILQDVREKLALIPGVDISVGQPISHKIDHLLSGIYAQIAVKLFGPDLTVLRAKAEEIRQAMGRVEGLVDLQVEKQVLVPQVRIQTDRWRAAAYGLRVGAVTETLETAFNGVPVSQVLDQQRTFDIFLRYDDPWRNDLDMIRNALIDTPTGAKIPISTVATVEPSQGPNQILHENGLRRIVVQANVSGRDLGSVIQDVRRRIEGDVSLPSEYFVSYGGQFESQQQASGTLAVLGVVSVLAIFVILYSHFGLARIALQIMANLPLAIIGGVIAIFLSGGTLSVASMVGFITLFGIVSRNGIMMISHYIHLMRYEGEVFDRPMIIRGTLERLVPVLMTALAAGIALVPLVLARGAPGKEILYPVATVILGGLVSCTLLNMAVTPSLFYKFGRPIWEAIVRERGREEVPEAGGTGEPQPAIQSFP